MRFLFLTADDFGTGPRQLAQLKPEHVLALRLYTTLLFKTINEPLRDQEWEPTHEFKRRS